MPEAVRLVVWDLDGVLWRGTITEGAIEYNFDTHNTIIELARRGIISSICSNNDFEQIRVLLTAQGIWDYFILPSIAWEPKGPRLQALVEAVQLRPETILFVDDNQMNLAEARHFVPSIRVADERFVPGMLDSPLLVGKDDRGLSRLHQYKLLERRHADQKSGSADHIGFLRSSRIRVRIDYDIESNLERTIELVNRTNQLNFTKSRLPEDLSEAREALRGLLRLHWIQAGIVQVADKYGDYGYCGFYMLSNVFSGPHLLHYCFSCRILHMGIESWLYQELGRPMLAVVGDVLTDLHAPGDPPDWISYGPAAGDNAGDKESHIFSCVVARGGCDISAITHYCRPVSGEIHEELTTVRNGIEYRTDHSLLLLQATHLPEVRPTDVFGLVGYQPHDLASHLFRTWHGRAVMLLSFFGDAYMPIYRHRTTAVRVPLLLPTGIGDVTKMPDEAISNDPAVTGLLELRQILQDDFEYEGLITEPGFKSNLCHILSALDGSEAYILRPQPLFERNGQVVEYNPFVEQLNAWVDDVIRQFPNVRHTELIQFVHLPEEHTDANHFDRKVYYRFFQALRDGRIGHGGSPSANAGDGASPSRQRR